MTDNPPEEKTVEPKRCVNLLSKGMYLNFGLTEEERCSGDGYFWCGETQRSYGPDGRICDLDECTNSDRECYEDC